MRSEVSCCSTSFLLCSSAVRSYYNIGTKKNVAGFGNDISEFPNVAELLLSAGRSDIVFELPLCTAEIQSYFVICLRVLQAMDFFSFLSSAPI